jgi:hypothetical protein
LKPTKAPVETIEEIPVQEIKPFRGIPDFREPTTSPYPAIARLGDDWLCIDGPELIEKAVSAGETKLRCRVLHLDHANEIEVALLKTAIRVIPTGGTCLYPEIVRNTQYVFAMLMTSPQPPAIFAHGGARRGESFSSNREEDVRTVLSSRLGKSRNTISNYLVHGEYLSDEALAFIITRSLGKDFFEKAQVAKRILVKNLKSDGLSESEVIQAASAQIILWATDYQEGRPLRDPEPPEDPEQPAAAASPVDEPAPGVPAPEIFDHWKGETIATESPSIPAIRAELYSIRELIDRAPGNDTELLACAQDLALEIIETGARIQQLAIRLQAAESEA